MIKIFKKLILFKNFKTSLILPKTSLEFTIFPTKIEIRDKEKKFEKLEYFLDFKSVYNLKIFLNLEKYFIKVRGFSKEGFFNYEIALLEDSVNLIVKKGDLSINGKILKNKKSFLLFPLKNFKSFKENPENIYLGVDKKMDMESIKKREDLKEILPVWFKLANNVLVELPKKLEGIATLFEELEKLLKKGDKKGVETLFLDIFRSGFYGIFSPRLLDEDHFGVIKRDTKISKNSSDLILLKKGAEFIRKLFFEEKKNRVEILLNLLPSFFSGRFVDIESSFGIFDLKWSKKLLKEMVLKSKIDGKISFKFQSKIKSFRVRETKREKGTIFKSSSVLNIKKEKIYLFDRFQK